VVVGISGAIALPGFDSNTIVEHNTVVNGTISCDVTHQGNICKAVIRNNITGDIVITSSGGTGSPSYNDYNLCTGGPCAGGGPHSLTGTPTYVGGASPTTYAGFALTAGSLGHNAGSDGKDIGTSVSGIIGSQPLPPTGLVASVQ
jgi:hypothetical protein